MSESFHQIQCKIAEYFGQPMPAVRDPVLDPASINKAIADVAAYFDAAPDLDDTNLDEVTRIQNAVCEFFGVAR